MAKQLFVIGMAAVMFVGVWVLVLLQFHQPQKTIELSTSAPFEGTEERIFDFPESISQSKEKEVDEEDLAAIFDTDLKKEIKEEKTSNELGSIKLDLRDYDFSDVSTVEGVPIGAILDKLNLE